MDDRYLQVSPREDTKWKTQYTMEIQSVSPKTKGSVSKVDISYRPAMVESQFRCFLICITHRRYMFEIKTVTVVSEQFYQV